jgi:hypothetical protein
MKLVNLTPHPIVLQAKDGSRTAIEPSGSVARVASTPGQLVDWGLPVPVAMPQTWGSVEGLPEFEEGTLYIVSLLLLGRPEVQARGDCLAPGTGPNDGAVRVADGPRKGQIEAVTRLVCG